MTIYAVVENTEVIEVYDTIPTCWRNVSNFFALENSEDDLKLFGWYEIVKQDCDPAISWSDPTYVFDGTSVSEVRTPT